MINYRLSANSLFITIVLAMIFGILCSLLIVLAYNHEQIRRDEATDRKLERNLVSAINLTLADTSVVTGSRSDLSDLFGDGDDSAWIRKENWGLYAVACARVMSGKKARQKNYFFGQLPDRYLEGCLYVAEQDAPLSLVGNTRLTGTGFLPRAGLRPAFIDQRSYGSSELIRGAVETSGDSLPVVDQRLIDRLLAIMAYKGKDGIDGQAAVENGMGIFPDSLSCSFADTIRAFYHEGATTLHSGCLKGHILIVSDSSITVNADMTLENVILAAPVIVFETGFSGTLQAIATDSLIVKNNCHFGYPSSLILCKPRPAPEQPAMIIGDSCTVEGTVLSHAPEKDMNKTYVESGKNSTIEGLLFVSGFLFLRGVVHGTVMTDKFIYKSSPNILLNYLVDAEIDRTALSKYFVGPHIFHSSRENRVMQWVE